MTSMDNINCSTKEDDVNTKQMNDKNLERLAAEELLKEAATLAKIAQQEGALGWRKRRILRANKMFLQQTIKRAVDCNNLISHEYKLSNQKPYAKKKN